MTVDEIERIYGAKPAPQVLEVAPANERDLPQRGQFPPPTSSPSIAAGSRYPQTLEVPSIVPPYTGPNSQQRPTKDFGPPGSQYLAQLSQAVTHVESDGRPGAKGKKGELGAMQLMPATAKAMGVTDLSDPVQLQQAGQKYLGNLLKQYKGDTEKALAAYNWGPGRVNRLVKEHGEDWHQHLPSIVKSYVGKVVSALGNFFSPSSAMAAEDATASAAPTAPTTLSVDDIERMYGGGGASATPGPIPGSAISKIPENASVGWGALFPGAQWEQPGQPEAGGNPAEAAGQMIGGTEGHYGEAAGQLIGGGLGAAVGSPLPGPGKAIVEAGGTTIGGAIGALGDHYWSPPEGQSLMQHLGDAVSRGVQASILGQAAGKVISGAGKMLFGPGAGEFKPSNAPWNLSKEELAKAAEGGRIGPGQMSDTALSNQVANGQKPVGILNFANSREAAEAVAAGKGLSVAPVKAPNATLWAVYKDPEALRTLRQAYDAGTIVNDAGRKTLAPTAHAAIGKALGYSDADIAKFYTQGTLQADAQAYERQVLNPNPVSRRYESFKKIGMESVPPSVVKGAEAGGWKSGMQEAAFGSTAFGADYKHAMAERVSSEAEQAVTNVLEKRFPGISNDYAALGLGLEEQQIANQEAIRNQVSDRFKTPARMLAASQGYKAANVIFDVMGNMVKPKLSGPTPSIQEAVAALRRTSSADAGYNRVIRSVPPKGLEAPATPQANALAEQMKALANRLAPAEKIPPRNDLLAQRRAAARAAGNPTALDETFKLMGLDPDAPELTYDQLKHLVQKNLILSHTSTDPSVRKAANVVGAAALKDLNGLLEGAPGAQLALKKASEFYNNEYVDVFVKSPEAKVISNKGPLNYSQIAESYISPDTSLESLARIEKLLGPRGADAVYKVSQRNLIRDSVVRGTGEGGMFSINKYLGQIDKYKTPVLQKMYGADYPAFQEVISRFRDIDKIYRASLNASGTAGQMHTYSGMMNAAKLAVFAGVGMFTGAHLGANAVISAALGATLPSAMAYAWFSPKMLKYWVEGFHWTPTMKNAAKVANHIATRMAATAATVMTENQPDVQIQIEPPPRAAGKFEGYTVQP